MNSLVRYKRCIGFLLFSAVIAAPLLSAYAEEAKKPAIDNTAAKPVAISGNSGGVIGSKNLDTASLPTLAKMIEGGVRPYFLGARSNVDGWLMVKDGQVQVVYIPVGAKDVIVGAMYDGNGASVTEQQVAELAKSNPQLTAELSGETAKKMAAIEESKQTASPHSTDPAHSSPGEKLLKDLEGASSVTIGDGAAPMSFMVMDTTCKHCQATWKILRDAVLTKKLRLRLVPIGDPDSFSERSAGILLRAPDPLTAWDRYVAGEAKVLDGKPDEATVAALRANHVLVDSWRLDVTPYFVYRSKSGVAKIIRGEIKDAAVLLSDLP